MSDTETRVRIDNWLWATAPDKSGAAPFAGRGASGRLRGVQR
jgi:hypothetical protein